MLRLKSFLTYLEKAKWIIFNILSFNNVVVVWNGIHSRPDTNWTAAERLFFYYSRLLYCPDQMLAVMVLNHHRVLLSEIVRPFVPFGTRYIGHAIRMWSAVCSATPHSQFGQGAINHLCMDEWNRPTPIRRRLSLTQAVRVKLIPNRPGTGSWV